MDNQDGELAVEQGEGDTPSPQPSADDWNRQIAQRKLGKAQAETTAVARDPAVTVRPSVKPLPAKESGWGSKMLDFAKHTTAAVGRGLTDAADNFSNTEVALGSGIVHGAIKAARATGVADSHFGSDWEAWYSAGHTADVNPLQIGEDRKDALFGEKRDGVYGFIEDATAFAVGYAATGVALKGVGLGIEAAEAAGATSKAITATRMARGAVTDASFLDPYKSRLSNMIQNAPPAIQYPITQLLQARDDDNEAEARLKSALEGTMTGLAIDKLVGAIKLARPLFGGGASKASAKVAASIADAEAVAKRAQATPDAVIVRSEPDGTFKLVPNAERSGADAPEYMYHATNAENAADIAESGKLDVHTPDFGAEQDAWPDGSTSPRAYFGKTPNVMDFAPEDGAPVLLRVAKSAGTFEREVGTGDMVSHEALAAEHLEMRQPDGTWSPLVPRAESPVFKTAADAESHAASINEVVADNALPKGTVTREQSDAIIGRMNVVRDALSGKLTAEQLDAHGIASAGDLMKDPTKLSDWITQGLRLNVSFTQTEPEMNAMVSELANQFQEVFVGARNRSADGIGTSFQKLYAGAVKAAQEGDPNSWAQTGFQDAATIEQITARQMARRVVTNQLAQTTHRLARALDANPENAIARDNFTKSATHLLNLGGGQEATASEAGRLLGSHRADALTGAMAKMGAKREAAAAAEASSVPGIGTPERAARNAKATVTDVIDNPPNYVHDVLEGISPEDVKLAKERMANEAVLGKAAKGPADPAPGDVQGPRTAEHAASLQELREKIISKAEEQRSEPVVVTAADREAAKASVAKSPRSDMERAMDAILDEPSNYPEPQRIGNAAESPLQPQAPRAVDPMRDLITKGDIPGLARQIVLNEGDPSLMIDAMLGHARMAADPTKWEKFNAYRANAMLSGPRTFFVNAISNAVAAVQMPAEYWLAGAGSGNSALRRQGWEMGMGVFHNYRSAWTGFQKAWASGENALDRGASQIGDSGQAIHMGSNSWLSTMAQAPSRLLMATDEFFKNLNYLNAVRGLSVRKSMEQGITDAGEIASRLAEDIRGSTNMDGRAMNPIALNYARTSTYQSPLEYGLGQSWQDMVQKHPAMRVITPFVRTPVNLARFAWQRTPALGMLQRQMQEDLAAGGDRAALAMSKQAIGTAVWGTAAWHAANGSMTGRGPSDPRLRAQWIEAGNQPYSVKIPGTDKWISYARLDPLGTALGVTADVVSMSGDMHDVDIDETAGKFLAAISADVTSKTFLSSLSDFMSALSSGDEHQWKRLGYNLTGSMMPFGSLLRQTNPDDHWREVRSAVDNIASRLPGFSENLEPRRNILGKPTMKPPGYLNAAFNPFTVTFGAGVNPVQDELVQLGKSMAMPGVNLDGEDISDRAKWKPTSGKNQSPYDRWLELVDKPKYGKPLEAQLTRIMETDAWKNATSGTEYYPGGLKYKIASEIVTQSYDVAKQTMLLEYPTLNNQLIGKRAAGQASLANADLVQQMESRFQVKH